MAHPAFFDQVAPIRLRDPLSIFLGGSDDGVLSYSYAEVVKLAGHSCPTVAGAFLGTARALAALYGEDLPVRGEIAVMLRDGEADGVAGVIGAVAGFITGAAQAGGFKGIGGRFARHGLLAFDAVQEAELVFARRDGSAAVEVTYRPERVPADPAMRPLLQRAATGLATAEEQRHFGALWQERVRHILIDHAGDAELVAVRRLR